MELGVWQCAVAEFRDWACGVLELGVWSGAVAEFWNCGCVEFWDCGRVELWSCGRVEVLCPDSTGGRMELRSWGVVN